MTAIELLKKKKSGGIDIATWWHKIKVLNFLSVFKNSSKEGLWVYKGMKVFLSLVECELMIKDWQALNK